MVAMEGVAAAKAGKEDGSNDRDGMEGSRVANGSNSSNRGDSV